MDMKSQIYSAYVVGLCPLQLLMKYGPDSHRRVLPAPAFDEASADLSRRPPRVLLFVLILGLAIGAWQLLSRTDETQASDVSAGDSPSAKGALLFVLILGLTIAAGELLSRSDGSLSAADVSAQASASGNRVVRA